MGVVHVAASWSKDEKKYNGLEAIAKELVDNPLQEHYIICKVTTKRITRDISEGGAEIPTVWLKHVEVMLTPGDEKAAKKLFDKACQKRLGELPQATLFEDVNPEDEDDGADDDGVQEQLDPSGVGSPFSG